MSVFVSKDTIRQIIERCLRGAASADNQQPWSFKWDGKTLTVSEAFQGLGNTDPARLLNTLNIGTIAETINIITSEQSIRLQPKFSYMLDPTDLGMQVTFDESSRPPDELLEAVEERWCDRRPYKSHHIDKSALINVRRDLCDGNNLYFSSDCKELNEVDTKNWSKLFMGSRLCKKDMYEWMRFSDREAEKTRDGMHWMTFSSNRRSARLMQIGMNPSWLVHSLVRPLTYKAIGAARKFNRIFNLSAGNSMFSTNRETLGCITVGDSRSTALVEAGRSLIRIWMRLNRHGYSFQPKFTSPLMLSYRRPEAKRSSVPVMGLVSDTDIEECLDICRETFGFSEDETPVVIFRTGLPIGDKHYTTLRKNVADVLSFEKI